MKKFEKNIKKWCKALDSGKYKQTRGKLQDSRGYCCLGVACELFNKDHEKINGFLSGFLPCYSQNDPEWLTNINVDFNRKTGQPLTHLNDNWGFTFPEIATILELVYIHKILD
jgi:hypothetical protein